MTAYLFMLVLQPLLALTVWRLCRGRSRLAVGMMMAAGGMIFFKAVVAYRPAWEAALFPFIDYVKYQGFMLHLFAAVFFGACLAHLAVRRDRAAFTVLFVAVVAQSAYANHWLVDGRTYGSEVFADANLHCEQSTIYTCGPAACVSALAHRGVKVTERQMAGLCLTNPTGTGFFNVYRGVALALEGSPYRAALREAPVEALLKKGAVAVLCLPGHAIAVMGDGDEAIVDDPLASKPQRWNLERMRQTYTGTAVFLEPRSA